MFSLGNGVVTWKNVKQSCIINPTIKVEYVATYKAKMEVVWLEKFLEELEVVTSTKQPIILYCDNSRVVAQSKEPRHYKRQKHIERKYNMI